MKKIAEEWLNAAETWVRGCDPEYPSKILAILIHTNPVSLLNPDDRD